MSNNYHIDEIDRKILSFLVNNARMPFLEIARECNISGAAVHQRVKKMESNGVISGSRMVIKPGALGLNVCAFISVAHPLRAVHRHDDLPRPVVRARNLGQGLQEHILQGRLSERIASPKTRSSRVVILMLNLSPSVVATGIPALAATEASSVNDRS